ncbi:MAG: MraY family glycosyltransferase [bacterium]
MSCQTYIIPFIISFIIAIPAVLAIKKIAEKFKIVDDPKDSPERRLHSYPIPLLGGAAIFIAFFLIAGYYIFYTKRIIFPTSSILPKHLMGIFLGGLILIIGGFLDDKYKLKPKYSIIAPVISAIAVIAAGVSVNYITNPFGGIIQLDLLKITLFSWRGLPYRISLPSDLITFFWILGMVYTTKLLDGLDGLATGITIIGAIVIFGASLNKVYVIPQVALLAIILAGACAGFLIFNFNPAKIFLGEGGSTLCGFLLASLAILSQGKIAVTLLVMGIPILDVLWVIGRRLFSRIEKGGILEADRKHLHHRLLDAGFSHRGAVLFLYILVGSFGLMSLFLQSKGRFVALVALAVVMIGLGMWVVWGYKKNKN